MSSGLLKITIITATYNSERYLEQTILSVLNQTYPNIEYIIVDGASNDRTLEIVDKYRNRIDIVISEEDEGIYDAFNKGVKAATGDIISFMNSDDYYYSNAAVEKIMSIFMQDRDLNIVYGDVLAVDEFTGYKHYRGKELTTNDFKQGDMCPHQAFFCTMKMLQKYGLFDLSYNILADIDFVTKCFKNNECAQYVSETIAVFRMNGISSNLSTFREMKEEHAKINFKHFGNVTNGVDKSLFPRGNDVAQLYRMWFEVIFLREGCISTYLHDKNLKNVAIFGTGKCAYFMYRDIQLGGISVRCFLDNDIRMHSHKIYNTSIVSPKDLLSNGMDIDVIIMTIEGEHDEIVREELRSITSQRYPIYSWKELLYYEFKRR